MKVFTLEALASEAADQQTFVGKASLTRMNKAATQPNTNVYRVEFEASARTNWHSHIISEHQPIRDRGSVRLRSEGRQKGRATLVRYAPGHASKQGNNKSRMCCRHFFSN